MAFPTALTNAVDNVTDVLAILINAIEAKLGIGAGTAASATEGQVLVRTGTAGETLYQDSPTFGSLYRQALINGNFDVWQRATSVAMTTANAYTADRWYCETVTAGTDKTVSRQTAGVNGSYYSARVAMVEDVDELLTFSQALKSTDSIKFRGGKVTLSFYAKAGAEFVADNATLVCKIVTGKGTDQKLLAFTTSADAISANKTLTTGWVKHTITTTAVIAADITQIGVSFAFTHAGSGTTTNYFEVTQVQLCAGDVALPFQPKSYEDELRACERYCYVITTIRTNQVIGIGSGHDTDTAMIYVPFPVTMNGFITLIATASDWIVYRGLSNMGDATGMSLTATYAGSNACVINVTVAAGLTAGDAYTLQGDGTSGRVMIFESEL